MKKTKLIETISDYTFMPNIVITYNTKYSTGYLETKLSFFIEKYKKIFRLFKDVHIRDIYLYNSFNVVMKHFKSLSDVLTYAKERKHD